MKGCEVLLPSVLPLVLSSSPVTTCAHVCVTDMSRTIHRLGEEMSLNSTLTDSIRLLLQWTRS